MGGKAFKNLEPLSRELHDSIVRQLQATAPENIQVHTPLPLRTKQFFGDVDIFVYGTSSPWQDSAFLSWLNKSYNVIGAIHTSNSPLFHYLCNSSNFPQEFQVDIHSCAQPKFAALYSSGSYLGYLVGVIAVRLGFVLTSTGFFYKFNDSQGQSHRYDLGVSFQQALKILGYTSERFEFEDLEDLCEFVASCPYFDPHDFSSELRDSKVDEAFRILSSYPRDPRHHNVREKFPVTQEFIDVWPSIEKWRSEIELSINKKAQRRAKFNGSLVRLWIGLDNGPRLGKFLTYIKDEINNFAGVMDTDDMCDRYSSQFIEALIKEMWQHYKVEHENIDTNRED